MNLEIPSPAQVGVLGTAGVDTVSGGFITSHMLEDLIIFGMTFGAWAKLLLTISVLLIIIMNIPKAIMSWRKMLKGV